VLIGEHGEGGAMGVVLNRPSTATVGEALPLFDGVAGEDAAIHVGGPVEPGAITMLAEFDDPDDAETLVVGDVGFVRGDADPALIAGSTRRARVFAGYAGWAPGQLEGEIDEGAWWVVDAEPGDAWARDPGDLWRRVVARQPGRLRFASTYPEDPSLN
jgi:putative transcriptional regulator